MSKLSLAFLFLCFGIINVVGVKAEVKKEKSSKLSMEVCTKKFEKLTKLLSTNHRNLLIKALKEKELSRQSPFQKEEQKQMNDIAQNCLNEKCGSQLFDKLNYAILFVEMEKVIVYVRKNPNEFEAKIQAIMNEWETELKSQMRWDKTDILAKTPEVCFKN